MHNADADAAEALAARPTEGPLLCSENVSQELRQTHASHEEKQRMLEILQRVHDADAAERPATGLPGGDAEAADIPEDVLSDDTVARLLEQVKRSLNLGPAESVLVSNKKSAIKIHRRLRQSSCPPQPYRSQRVLALHAQEG